MNDDEQDCEACVVTPVLESQAQEDTEKLKASYDSKVDRVNEKAAKAQEEMEQHKSTCSQLRTSGGSGDAQQPCATAVATAAMLLSTEHSATFRITWDIFFFLNING